VGSGLGAGVGTGEGPGLGSAVGPRLDQLWGQAWVLEWDQVWVLLIKVALAGDSRYSFKREPHLLDFGVGSCMNHQCWAVGQAGGQGSAQMWILELDHQG
jgi:hypothetical protein